LLHVVDLLPGTSSSEEQSEFSGAGALHLQTREEKVMEEKVIEEKQWQYGLNIVFGLLLFFFPWLLGFEHQLPIRSWDFFVIGGAIVASAAVALHMRSRLVGLANLILGAWMVASPWIIGFSANTPARNGAIALGAMVFLMTLWAHLERVHYERVAQQRSHAGL